MSSGLLALRRVATSLSHRPLLLRRVVALRPATTPAVTRFFSAEPIVPGVGKGKTSTGYVGLAVEPDWYNVILNKFQALLDKMEASDMPETAQYRIDVTKWANFVIKTAKENPDDPEAVEEAVQMGQVEELIEMAEDEMIAMDAYLEVRMWELVEAANPNVNFKPDPMKDEMGPDGNPDVQDKIREGLDKMKEEKKE